MIYMDHASTTRCMFTDLIKRDLENYWSNPSNLYILSDKPKAIIQKARESIAEILGVEPFEIYFTSGSSEGNAWACAQRKKVCCSPYEHHNLTSNPACIIIDETWLDNALLAKEQAAMGQRMDNDYTNFLCSWMYVNNETGEIFDVKKLAQKAHKLGMIFHSDMTQAIGNVPINLKELDVDIATFSGHKIHTPKGIGFIYFNSERIPSDKIQRLIYGGIQENGLRAGTENVPYIDALRAAVHSACLNRVGKQNHCYSLKVAMVDELKKQNLNFIINSPGNSVSNILNVSFKDISGENLMMDLSDRNIYVSTGSACTSGLLEGSEVLQEMGVPEEYLHGAVRFSFDFENSKDDIISVAKHVGELIRSYES